MVMNAQYLVVFALVLGCSLYALWTIMPAVWSRALASRLLRLPQPAWLHTTLQKAATAGSGCDCSGCDKVAGPARPTPAQVIRFHPKPKG